MFGLLALLYETPEMLELCPLVISGKEAKMEPNSGQ